MTIQRLFLLASMVFLVFPAGCAKKADNAKTLSVVMGLAEEEWKVMRENIFPEFEKQYQCRVRHFQVEAGDFSKKLEAMVRAGNVTVDVFSQDNMRLAVLVNKDLVEDLSAYESVVPAEVLPAMREVGRFNGKLFFMPYRPNVQIAYYNEKRLEEAGLEPPQTWDELLHVARVLKEKKGMGKVGFQAWGDGPTTAQLYEFIVSAGGDPLLLNDTGCGKAFAFLKTLYPYLSPDSKKAKWDTTNTYLANESFYLAQNWPFGVRIVMRDYGKKEIKTYRGWRGPVREAHVIGGEVFGIPKGAQDKTLALAFIRYFQSKEVQEKLAARLGWPSIRDDAYGNMADWLKPHYRSVKEALEHGVYRPNVPYWDEFDKLLNEAFLRIVVQQGDVGEILNAYHEEMEGIKREYSR
ncbi:MAG: extracellular solute-binding protein [Lentisphaerae bacterium]|nr:extracellular solute-binding protein [Lentisphaerota bacterium]